MQKSALARRQARQPGEKPLSSPAVRQHAWDCGIDLQLVMGSGPAGRILREVEAPLIEIALDATAGNQARCADLLGINRNTLRKKITDLDIRVTRRRKLM